VSRDPKTYGSISKKFDAWTASEEARPERDRLRRVDVYSPPPQGSTEMSRMVAASIGIGIGVVLLALAAYAFYTASYWASFERDGAQVGYTLAGVFLLIAGVGGILATWNHNFRVLVSPSEHH